jgi:hypothetical protein
MRGHNDLIAMRIAGQLPACVSLHDHPIDTKWAEWGDLPRVCVDKDPVVDLDLRFVVGMVVHIDSHNERRAEQLFQKCIDAGAAIVASSTYPGHAADPYARQPSKQQIFFRHFQNQHDNHHYVRLD